MARSDLCTVFLIIYASEQSGAGWFFSIDSDGTNRLEHPMFLGETEWQDPDFGPYYGFF